MTREDAISELQLCVNAWDKWMFPGSPSLDRYKEAVRMALAALRGPTREQVEKVFRAHWEDVDSGSGMLSRCSNCGFKALYSNIYAFCPDCGRPFTDYAVDTVMKRLEKLYEDR